MEGGIPGEFGITLADVLRLAVLEGRTVRDVAAARVEADAVLGEIRARARADRDQ